VQRKKIVILGSTGSIGCNVLDVVSRFPDRFDVIGLSTHRRGSLLRRQVEEFHPRVVCATSAQGEQEFRRMSGGANLEIWEGEESLTRLAEIEDADLVVNALVGAAGLKPTVAALEAGNPLALANKESLVMAGEIIMALAERSGTEVRPIDSELSAMGQCLATLGTPPGGVRRSGAAEGRKVVRKVYLTASGGPFRGLDRGAMERVTVEEALRHPVWDMGPRITVDSATMMNKGFEILEAHWLFGFPFSDIEIIVHPQSVVHAIVELVDGFWIPLLSVADMRLPIQYALTCPERLPTAVPDLNLEHVGPLSFEGPDCDRFPCLRLAREAGESGQTYPAVLNAADEMAVRAFLEKRIGFLDIPRLIEECLAGHTPVPNPTVDDILEADRWARSFCANEFDGLSRRGAAGLSVMVPEAAGGPAQDGRERKARRKTS